MNTNNEAMLSMEEFHTQMTQQADRFAAVTALQNKLRFGRGMNQTLAMECEDLRPGFITSSNPIAGFSVQPSKTNLSLTLEELDKVKVGLLAAAVAIGAAILWKIIQWFKKWRSGDSGDGGGSGSGGDSGSSGSNYIAPDRVGVIINGSIDVLHALEERKVELKSAIVKSGKGSHSDIGTVIEDITTGAYTALGNKASMNFDNFINSAGMVKLLLSLHNKALKEAPTKLRDAFNKIEQVVTAYTESNSAEHQIGETAKLTQMVAEAEVAGSYWYGADEKSQYGAETPELLTSIIRDDVTKNQKVPSKLGDELKSKQSNFIVMLQKGLHGTYEKLIADVDRLETELSKDLQSKVTSLKKQLEGNVGKVGTGADGTENNKESKDFAAEADKIVKVLNLDLKSIGFMIAATKVISTDYLDVIGGLATCNEKIIDELIKIAKTNGVTEVQVSLVKLKNSNTKLTKKKSFFG